VCISFSLRKTRLCKRARDRMQIQTAQSHSPLSLSLFRARERSFFSLSLSLLSEDGAQKSAEVIFVFLFPFSTTFRVFKFLAQLFLGFLGARFAFGFPKEKDEGHSVRVYNRDSLFRFRRNIDITSSSSNIGGGGGEFPCLFRASTKFTLSLSLSLFLSQSVFRKV